MKKTLLLGIAVAACWARADAAPSMEDLEAQFEAKIVALAKSPTQPEDSLEAAIFRASISVFGDHAEVVSREADRRLAELPVFMLSDIPADARVLEFDLSGLFVSELKEFVNAFGWQPKRVAQTAKAAVLSRQTGVEQFGRRVLLKAALPNRYYRLEEATKPTIVVESLGDLFIVECWKHDRGVLVPERLRWVQRPLPEESPTEPAPES